ncbi:CRISPR-associated protein Cas5 [uncultured Ilyobacter sp.]|uniref:CRISPR-associated protein Cas5 n=1 Tax=uncultured Ilyobacter sp. TaxID=544433 RepID=UPI0029F5C90C|nr:CRISPR-associated protein Cas5 [uncultured Ilyobacter sp.]
MKALRIILTQNKAHYRKEETMENKMTYPLPPFSTVIGALHNACGFRKYKPMNISVQGKYDSLSKQAYTDHCFHDKFEDDRATLVKLVNKDLYSKSFIKVAKGKKNQGNSFKKGVTIDIFNQNLIEEYRKLKDLKDEIEIFKIRFNCGKNISNECKKIFLEKNSLKDIEENKLKIKEFDQKFKKYKKDKSKGLIEVFKKRKQSLKLKKKNFNKKSKEFLKISIREKEIKEKEELIKDKIKEFEFENFTKHISKYKLLTTSLKHYEILHNVKLIIHIDADEEVLDCIKENIYNLKAVGRSEDFVDVKECEVVELLDKIDTEISSEYSAYLNYELVKNESILLNTRESSVPASGTKYWINKVYDNSTGKRDFSKGKKIVLYASNYSIDEESKGVYFDSEGKYIVNFN